MLPLDDLLPTLPILKLGLLSLMRIWRLIPMSLRLYRRKDLGLFKSLPEIVSVWPSMPRERSEHGEVSEYVPS